MIVVCFIFFILNAAVSLPLTVATLIVNTWNKNSTAHALIKLVAFITIGLMVGCLVNGILGFAGIYACGWVSFGLGCGGVVVSLINFASAQYFRRHSRQTYTYYRVYQAPKTQTPTQPAQPVVEEKKPEPKETNMNYIEELKELKNLLDSGILTQEEFDAKKKEILSR